MGVWYLPGRFGLDKIWLSWDKCWLLTLEGFSSGVWDGF